MVSRWLARFGTAAVKTTFWVTNMIEAWKAIVGFEGLYEVSDQGRVRSLDRIVPHGVRGTKRLRGRVRSLAPDSGGYPSVTLYLAGKGTTVGVHRLVAQSFLAPSDLPEVNHKDARKDNNSVGNLEWVTGSDNMEHARQLGRLSAATNPNMARKLSVASVATIRKLYTQGRSRADIARQFQITVTMVSRILTGKSWAIPEPAQCC